MTDDRIHALRRRVAAIDAQLVRTIAERLTLAAQIGAAKREDGLPLRSFATETEVRDRFRHLAADHDLDEDLADRLSHLLISEAVRRQEEPTAGRAPHAQRMLIVGGAGEMGRWLGRFFAGQGHAVATWDPAGPVPGLASAPSLAAGVRAADVVLVATPLAAGAPVLAEVLGAGGDPLIADVFSLKSHILETVRTAAGRGQRVASLHPLFGPSARTLSGRVMAVCDCGHAAAADAAAALFADTALTITRLSVAEHDRYMMYVLGLSHLTALLFCTTLVRSGPPFAELARVASTTFWKEARTAAEVSRESATLYHEIQHLNRHSPTLYRQVRNALHAVEEAALADDPGPFTGLMAQGRAYFPAALPTDLE